MTGAIGRLSAACGLLLAATAGDVAAQPTAAVRHLNRPLAAHIVVPQARSFGAAATQSVQVTEVNVGVVIVEQVATTTMDIHLQNPTSRRLEAELIVPVPDKSAVRGFTFQGAASEPTAELLARSEARQIYDRIVSKMKDPALLEFVGYNLIRSAVFPVEPNGTQKLRLTYEHLLSADGPRVDYVLPRSEAVDYGVPWRVAVKIKSKSPISTVYSPSHQLETTRAADGIVSARIAKDAVTQPGAFRLSYLLDSGGVTASLLAYPDPQIGGGYFLLLAGLPPKPAEHDKIRREVTLVIDRSGSMNGEKLEQAREAALQVLAGLEDGEAFNVITYNQTVDVFSPQPVVKSRESEQNARKFIQGIRPQGGTNIHDALLEALRPTATKDTLPMVLFLTDELPTIGQTSEAAIRNVATKANPYNRRVFTFGVGVDVNTPLLENIAYETRATVNFVLPEEDVEVKVGSVFKKLAGPVFAEPKLQVLTTDGERAPSRVRDVLPQRLPDLFDGDQLVLLGQYSDEEPLVFRVTGNYLGKPREFKFQFDFAAATTRNAFVPRLWASRQIGVLMDGVREAGADPQTLAAVAAGNAAGPVDPKLKELIDEIVRLSLEFGILTEYTAFLAREGTDLSQKDQILAEANRNFYGRAVGTRVGLSSVNQDNNLQYQKAQMCLNTRNEYWDANMQRVAITRVQQVNDRAFYRQQGRWVDSRLVESEQARQPRKTVEFGSPDFMQLVQKLASNNRQGCVSMGGDVVLEVDGEAILIKAPASAPAQAEASSQQQARPQ